MLEAIHLLWSLIKPHLALQRQRFLLAVVLTACATACSLAASWLLKGLIDLPKPGGSLQEFLVNVSLVAALYLAAFFLWAGQQTLAAIMTERIFVAVKTRLLLRLLDQPYSMYDNMMHGDILVRLTGNLRQAAVTFRDDVVAGLFEMMFILGIVIALFMVSWKIGAVAVVGLLAYALIIKLVNRPWVLRADTAKRAGDDIADIYVDVLAAARDIRIFNLASRVSQKFGKAAEHYADVQIVLSRFAAILKSFFVLSSALAVLLLVTVYGALIIWQASPQDARLTAGELVVMLTIMTILLSTLNQLLLRVGRLIAAQPSLNTLRFLTLPQKPLRPHAIEQPPPHDTIPAMPSIEFLNLNYSRSAGQLLFDDFNLNIKAGEKIALMGATGTGKSILLDLLMRLREPDSGRILFSGIDIAHIQPALYYSAFGFVGQHSYVMQLTLKEFLRQGWPGQQDEDLWRVLNLVKLGNMVRGLPQQLDTRVGFYARGFSSNEVQRLAVARALLRDPQVLVLDEFTATLDSAAELELVRDVLAFSPKRTIICTTYSVAVSALFDRVVELRAGQ